MIGKTTGNTANSQDLIDKRQYFDRMDESDTEIGQENQLLDNGRLL